MNHPYSQNPLPEIPSSIINVCWKGIYHKSLSENNEDNLFLKFNLPIVVWGLIYPI